MKPTAQRLQRIWLRCKWLYKVLKLIPEGWVHQQLKPDAPDGSSKLSKAWSCVLQVLTAPPSPEHLHSCPIPSLTLPCPLVWRQHSFGARPIPPSLRKSWHSSKEFSSLWLCYKPNGATLSKAHHVQTGHCTSAMLRTWGLHAFQDLLYHFFALWWLLSKALSL